ncbi:PepSY domain-containing protein [Mesorhizobium sp. BAC0120]|uniref:PepSY domain-containing protein n=1 Tax=Mesorhizobium sp. BAC0120 TaxID=3090670 RepID=UPI00298C2BF0|nr:PepSY domain-containing protein [Mesorhizobium sp. BAC0120]MDW6020180.1 PepSY domain-containing protein [Mesorhizobium sp. BAC0120]
MRPSRLLWSGFAAVLLCAPAFAQTTTTGSPIPPPNAMKLSEIIAKVEQRDQFAYVSEIDWSEEGYYDITYFTTDKAKVEIKADPVTGKPK